MDIGKQQRVIMVEPLELTMQAELEALLHSQEEEEEAAAADPIRSPHHPWQAPADPTPGDGDGDDDVQLYPTRRP